MRKPIKIFNINSKEDIDQFIEYQVKEFIIRSDFKQVCNEVLDRLSTPEWQSKTTEEKAKKVVAIAGMSIGIPAAIIILEKLGLLTMLMLWLSPIWR